MRKRPVFWGAVLLALLIWIIYGLLEAPAFPTWTADTEVVLLQGRFRKAEEKSSSMYLYLDRVICWTDAEVEKDEERGVTRKENAQGAQVDGAENVVTQMRSKAGAVDSADAPASENTYRKVLLTLPKDEFASLSLLPGNEIRLKAKHTGFRTARNAGNFDEEKYYHCLGVAEKFEASGKVQVTGRTILPVHAAMQWLKEKLKDALLSVTGGDAGSHAEIFAAIVTGDRTGLDSETQDLYRRSGIAHILAVSGLHISLIGMSLFSFLRKRFGFGVSGVISGIVMIFFFILSGESASAFRATAMFLMRILAMKMGKSFDLLTGLGLSAILLLIYNPQLLFYSGFQLSFGAIAGIGILEPAFRILFLKTNPERPREVGLRAKVYETVKKIGSSFFSSLAVTLFTLPIIINSYYEIPLFSVLLNLIVVPLMGLVLGSGLLSALAGLLSLFLGRILIGAGVYLVSLIEFLCALSDYLPFSILVTGHMSPVRVIVYYGILLLVVQISARYKKKVLDGIADVGDDSFTSEWQGETFLPSDANGNLAVVNTRSGDAFVPSDANSNLTADIWQGDARKVKLARRLRAVAAILLMSLALPVFAFRGVRSPEIVMLDVDQGESILLRSPSGANYLIDGGSTGVQEVYRYRMESALKYLGISELDAVFVTHPDTDHVSGIMEMLGEADSGSIRIGRILTPEVSGNTNYEALLEAAEKRDIPVESLHAGMTIHDANLSFRCLHPSASFSSPDSNAYSAVLELNIGNFRALLTGDLSKEEEQALLRDGVFFDTSLLSDNAGSLSVINLLKVAHHGSKNSTTQQFLDTVRPETAIISAGVNNSYGHPNKETLERLKKVGADIYVTAQSGELFIQIRPDGTSNVRPFLTKPPP